MCLIPPAVRPDARPAAAARFRGIDERGDINVAVIVPGIGCSVGAVVVELGEIDGSVGAGQNVPEELAYATVSLIGQ
jgi:hypothetical protein